jgi:hypothetical protein
VTLEEIDRTASSVTETRKIERQEADYSEHGCTGNWAGSVFQRAHRVFRG